MAGGGIERLAGTMMGTVTALASSLVFLLTMRLPARPPMPFSIRPCPRFTLAYCSGFWSLILLLVLSRGPAYAEWVSNIKGQSPFEDWSFASRMLCCRGVRPGWLSVSTSTLRPKQLRAASKVMAQERSHSATEGYHVHRLGQRRRTESSDAAPSY